MTKHVLCYLFIVSLIKVGTIMAGHRHIPTTEVAIGFWKSPGSESGSRKFKEFFYHLG